MAQSDERIDKKTTSILVVALSIIVSLGLMAIIDKTDRKLHPVLTSWTDNSVRSSIIYFVDTINNQHGTNYVKDEDRIAVFDIDGTIMVEKPLSIEMAFFQDAIPESLKDKHPYNALLKRDFRTLFKGNNYNKIFNLYSNIPVEDYKEKIKKWMRGSVNPHYNRNYLKLAYKPMKELMAYLKDNRFEIYLVTGTENTIARTYSRKILNVPEDHVIGSEANYAFADGVITRTKDEKVINIGKMKPIDIERAIGKKPIVAFGNTDDDLPMMEYVGTTDKMKLVGLITHTDKEREFVYSGNEKALDMANKKGWLIVDMKTDFKEMFDE